MMPTQNKLFELLTKKWFLAITCGLLTISLLVFIASFTRPKPNLQSDTRQKTTFIPPLSVPPQKEIQPTIQPTIRYIPPVKITVTVSPLQAQAIAEAVASQQKADQDYTDWQDNIRTNYPWKRYLPLHTEKYYVYFDLNKKTFIGLLYPQAQDNVGLMKNDILRQLKEEIGVPVDNFKFEWTVK